MVSYLALWVLVRRMSVGLDLHEADVLLGRNTDTVARKLAFLSFWHSTAYRFISSSTSFNLLCFFWIFFSSFLMCECIFLMSCRF